jgi:hypothetical protein
MLFMLISAIPSNGTKNYRKKNKAKLLMIEVEIKTYYDILSHDYNEDGIKEVLRCLEIERNYLLRSEEEHWRLQSRALWLAGGDRNTKYFHKVASHNRIKKHIWKISRDDGEKVTDQHGIKSEAVQYFKHFYSASTIPNIEEQFKLLDLFPVMVGEEEAVTLYNPVTMAELKLVLFHCKKEKSLGPDGWSTDFFIHFFDLVGEDLLQMVEESRLLGKIVGGLNSTFLTLIPKVIKPKTFEDFRPISLCNLCYNLISKIIANRIKPFLSKSLSPEQMGFLKGRQIQDAIGTTHEILHSIKKKKLKALVLKLDIKKAYDSIDWNLLRLILLKVGVGLPMANWIMSCITSSSFVVLINGEATNFFRSGRGLWQGCPLSPLLFILIMEGLNLLLKKRQAEGAITGLKIASYTIILHLLFVDDILILSKASLSEWRVIDKLLILFCKASGLAVNPIKSTTHYSGLSEQELIDFKSTLNYTFNDLNTGFCYLGYHLKIGSHRASDWDWIVAKISRKINLWGNRWLSLAGRYTLMKSVLEGQNSILDVVRSHTGINHYKNQKNVFQFSVEWQPGQTKNPFM